ncbi:hypothetical protein ACHAWF_015983 [Thalassiosira exigua]
MASALSAAPFPRGGATGGGRGLPLSYESDPPSSSPSSPSSSSPSTIRSVPLLFVNGSPVPPDLAARARPVQTLLDFVRTELKLTGTKLGCGEGGCGACTVLVSRVASSESAGGGRSATRGATRGGGGRGGRSRSSRLVHASANACLLPVLACDGCHVTTVEGVGSLARPGGLAQPGGSEGGGRDGLHPVQRAMADLHGSQCGYCTPGIIVALYALFAQGERDSEGNREAIDSTHLEEHLDGNLCRCTGYRPIWDAARALCADGEGGGVGDLEDGGPTGPCGTPCRECPAREACERECNAEDRGEEKKEGHGEGRDEKKGDGGREKEEGCGTSIVCTSTASKVAEYQTILKEKHSETWWDQPDRMFPRELLPVAEGGDAALHEELSKPLTVVSRDSVHGRGTWIAPTRLEDLLDLFRERGDGAKDDEGKIKMVVGNTEVGIEARFKRATFPRLVRPTEKIHTLYEILTAESHLVVGACASLTSLMEACRDHVDASHELDAADAAGVEAAIAARRRRARTAAPIRDMLRWFASTQIRNAACLGGNVVTASPISDMNPLLCALDATLVLASRPERDGGVVRRTIPAKDFFVSYRTVAMESIEMVERIDVPWMRDTFEYVVPFKQARRREDDISIVTSGMRMKLAPRGGSWIVEDVCLAFGGMAPKTVAAKETAEAMMGRPFEEETFAKARVAMMEELALPEDVPGGQSQYRLALACGFLHKMWLHCARELKEDVVAAAKAAGGCVTYPPVPTVGSDEASGAGNGFVSRPKPRIGGVQKYPAPKVAVGLEGRSDSGIAPGVATGTSEGKEGIKAGKVDSVGKPAPHASGPLHCTGEALYADDVPAPPGTLHAALIMASKCHVALESLDVSPALSVPGVEGAFAAEDVTRLGGTNAYGPIKQDDVAFLPTGEVVAFVGQVLGVVVGASLEIAERGARAVEVRYGEEMGKAPVSIEDAIEAGSFWSEDVHGMKRGEDVDEMLERTEVDGKRLVVVEGSFRSGGQEHFYLETNSCLVIPSESSTQLLIHASTQAPTKTQECVAKATGTPCAKVVVRMKRMGGGFGGKETRSVFTAVCAAVAAKRMGRPVRLTLPRDADMKITGGRHAFLSKYRAGALVDDEGKVRLHALDVRLYNNGGAKFDLTGPVMDRALFHVDGCYNWPNFRSRGTPCKTVQPPHTAFRGFGGPQGMAVCEHVMDHLAEACGVDGDELRRTNLYEKEDATPFGMQLGVEDCAGKWNVPKMWDRLSVELDVPGRRASAAEFNRRNKWVKRGVGFVPTKFGIAYTAKFMNQGGALVHLYTDGTVLVSHGGTEMGQGLHTKVCQVAAQAFGVPLDRVFVDDSSTDKVANTVPTAASMSTDLYGMATLDACRQILARLRPIRESLPAEATLKEVAQRAHFERVDLSAHGFFALDDKRCGYDWDATPPTPGSRVALAEVEVDVLTGDHRTFSADVLVDVGASLNPAIDLGQIEGAFVQGMGWSTLEEVVLGDDDHVWIRPRGTVFTSGPGTYKIPAFNDVPEKFNVSLLEDADNPFVVHSGKAIGEPPFFLGCSVFFAIKDAVRAAREGRRGGRGDEGPFEFRMPATSERIRMACADEISAGCAEAAGAGAGAEGSFQPKGSY